MTGAVDRDASLARAVRLREDGLREESREQLVALSARFPDDAEVAYQTAWVHDALGLEADAVPYYVRALADQACVRTTGVALCSASAARTALSAATRRRSPR